MKEILAIDFLKKNFGDENTRIVKTDSYGEVFTTLKQLFKNERIIWTNYSDAILFEDGTFLEINFYDEVKASDFNCPLFKNFAESESFDYAFKMATWNEYSEKEIREIEEAFKNYIEY